MTDWPTHCIHGNVTSETCSECQAANLVDPEVDAVAWAILQALHDEIDEDKRPMSWSDMSQEQEQRIRAAAVAAIECIRAKAA